MATLKRGIFKTWPVNNGVHVAYSFTADDALFIGAASSSDERITFRPLASTCSNVMLFWRQNGSSLSSRKKEKAGGEGGVIYLMTSADADLILTPAKFVPSLHAETVKVQGDYGRLERHGEELVITALAGETIAFSN